MTDTLEINGLTCPTKEIDAFLLKMDDIYHLGAIVKEDGNRLEKGVIEPSIYVLNNQKKLLIVQATPKLGVMYKLRNGSKWYRLSASNYRLQDVSHEQELEIAKQEVKTKEREMAALRSEMAFICSERNGYKAKVGFAEKVAKDAREAFLKLQADTAAFLQVAQKADANAAELAKLLEASILEQKKLAEERLAEEQQPRSWWSSVASLF